MPRAILYTLPEGEVVGPEAFTSAIGGIVTSDNRVVGALTAVRVVQNGRALELTLADYTDTSVHIGGRSLDTWVGEVLDRRDGDGTHPAEFPHDPFAADTWWTGEAVAQLLRGANINPQRLQFRISLELNIETSVRAGQVVILEVDYIRATGDPYLDGLQ